MKYTKIQTSFVWNFASSTIHNDYIWRTSIKQEKPLPNIETYSEYFVLVISNAVYVDGFVQYCNISIANVLEILQPSTKTLISYLSRHLGYNEQIFNIQPLCIEYVLNSVLTVYHIWYMACHYIWQMVKINVFKILCPFQLQGNMMNIFCG